MALQSQGHAGGPGSQPLSAAGTAARSARPRVAAASDRGSLGPRASVRALGPSGRPWGVARGPRTAAALRLHAPAHRRRCPPARTLHRMKTLPHTRLPMDTMSRLALSGSWRGGGDAGARSGGRGGFAGLKRGWTHRGLRCSPCLARATRHALRSPMDRTAGPTTRGQPVGWRRHRVELQLLATLHCSRPGGPAEPNLSPRWPKGTATRRASEQPL